MRTGRDVRRPWPASAPTNFRLRKTCAPGTSLTMVSVAVSGAAATVAGAVGAAAGFAAAGRLAGVGSEAGVAGLATGGGVGWWRVGGRLWRRRSCRGRRRDRCGLARAMRYITNAAASRARPTAPKITPRRFTRGIVSAVQRDRYRIGLADAHAEMAHGVSQIAKTALQIGADVGQARLEAFAQCGDLIEILGDSARRSSVRSRRTSRRWTRWSRSQSWSVVMGSSARLPSEPSARTEPHGISPDFVATRCRSSQDLRPAARPRVAATAITSSLRAASAAADAKRRLSSRFELPGAAGARVSGAARCRSAAR